MRNKNMAPVKYIDELLNSAQDQIRNNRLLEARATIHSALEQDPHCKKAHLLMGRIYHLEGNTIEAMNEYELSFPFNGRMNAEDIEYCIKYYIRRAEQHVIEENYAAAIADFKEARSYIEKTNEEDSTRILVRIAECYFEISNYEQAYLAITKATEIIPNNYDLIYFRGVCLLLSGKLKSAMRDFNFIIVNLTSRINSRISPHHEELFLHSLRKRIEIYWLDNAQDSHTIRQDFLLLNRIARRDEAKYNSILKAAELMWDRFEKDRVERDRLHRPQFIERSTNEQQSLLPITEETCRHGISVNDCPRCAAWAPESYHMRWDD